MGDILIYGSKINYIGEAVEVSNDPSTEDVRNHLENDNVQRHEWPVCKDINYPLRLDYASLFGTENQASNFINKKNIEREKKLSEVKNKLFDNAKNVIAFNILETATENLIILEIQHF